MPHRAPLSSTVAVEARRGAWPATVAFRAFLLLISGWNCTTVKMMVRSPVATRRSSRKPSSAETDSAVFESESQNRSGAVVVSDNSCPSSASGTGTEKSSGQGRTGAKMQVHRLDVSAYKPWGSRSRASSAGSQSSASPAFCGGGPGKSCGEPVLDDDLGCTCDMCDKWFHCSCQDVPKPAYDALTEYNTVLSWFCHACKESLKQAGFPNIVSLRLKVENLSMLVESQKRLIQQTLSERQKAASEVELESKVDKLSMLVDTHMKHIEQTLSEQQKAASEVSLNSKVDTLAALVDSHMRHIDQTLREQEQVVNGQTKMIERSIRDSHTQKASYAEMVKGTCSDVVAKVSAKVASIPQSLASQTASKDMQDISKVFDNFLEKNKRKNNLVIHNLPESEGGTFKERTESDAKLFQEVVKDTFKMNVAVSKVYRVGKVVRDKPRLLIVTLDTPGVKGDVLRLAPQLRNSNSWGNIYITPDLTKGERDAARKVREELAARRSAGETNLTIRKGKVVSVPPTSSNEETRRPNHRQSPHGEPTQHTVPATRPDPARKDTGATTSTPSNGNITEGTVHSERAQPTQRPGA